MEISIKRQLICFLFSFVFGIAAAVLFGIFRLTSNLLGVSVNSDNTKFTKVFGAVLQFLLDILYCISVTVSFQILLYIFDFGRFRLAYLISGAAGFVLYSKSLGKIFNRLSEKAVFLIRKIVSFILYYVSLPFRIALKFICGRGKAIINLVIIKPYEKHVRRKYKKKVRLIMETKLSDLVKFDVKGSI